MESSSATRPLAVVPRASSGIGLELAKQFAANGFDLILAAEDEAISAAAGQIDSGASVEAVQVDLATSEGVDELYGRVTAVGAQGHRGDRDLADAGTDGDRVIRARRHARHQGGRRREGRDAPQGGRARLGEGSPAQPYSAGSRIPSVSIRSLRISSATVRSSVMSSLEMHTRSRGTTRFSITTSSA